MATWMETYKFPGWDRCMRCLCHTMDCCPDLEYLASLQDAEDHWNSLSDGEKTAYLAEVELQITEQPGEDWPF